MQAQIALPIDEIIAFCKRHPIRKLSLFGSVLRDDFDDESDVDMLVEFEPDAKITLFDLVHMRDELNELIGREVDFLTPGFLSDRFRDKVMNSAVRIYEKVA